MSQEQINSLIRNLVVAIAGAVSAYGGGTNQQVADVSALTIALAMLAWGIWDRSNNLIITLTRKVIQAVPPVLITFSVLTPDQGAAFLTLALVVVTTWSTIEKNK